MACFGQYCRIRALLVAAKIWIFTLPEESYYISTAPIAIDWFAIAVLNIGTLLICVLVLLLPTWLVTKIEPVKAIKFQTSCTKQYYLENICLILYRNRTIVVLILNLFVISFIFALVRGTFFYPDIF